MKWRPIGRSSLETAPIVLGATVFGWTIDQTMSFRILDAFVDTGFNAIDTADSYSCAGPGSKDRTDDSEEIIGNWLRADRGRRSRVLIFTKVGREMGPGKKGLSRRYIRTAVEGSLCRLGIERIDLYRSHRDDNEISMLETLDVYAELIRKGKVRAIGASNVTAARLKESFDVASANGLPRYECFQPRFNLDERDGFEGELEQLCLKEGIGVISYYALAGGFLTGKYRSPKDFGRSQRGSRMGTYMNPRGMKILVALDEIAKNHCVNPVSVALAWLIARPSNTAPIASVTSLEQLEDFSAALRLKLSHDEIALLNSASA